MRRDSLDNDSLKKIKKARIITRIGERYVISNDAAIIPKIEKELRGEIELKTCRTGKRLQLKINGRLIKSTETVEYIFTQK